MKSALMLGVNPKAEREENDFYATNPKAMELALPLLESKSRYKLFKKYPLKKLLVYSERQQCAKNAEFEKYTATTQCYCWFVFEKGYTGEPTIDWIIEEGGAKK